MGGGSDDGAAASNPRTSPTRAQTVPAMSGSGKGKQTRKREETRRPSFLLRTQTVLTESVSPSRPLKDNGYMTPPQGRLVVSNRDGTPLYMQFNGYGVHEVPHTLLTITRRFDKLARWTAAHIRALEERIGDVERWNVNKEKEKECEEKEKSKDRAQVQDPSRACARSRTSIRRKTTRRTTTLLGRVKNLSNDRLGLGSSGERCQSS
jgi:hypothetical protein